MRTFIPLTLAAGLIATSACVARTSAASDTAAPASPTTVLVELFTSEGCSSCPPADAELTDLLQQQPLRNITVVALGEHVDYWDQLGWRDQFSSPAFTSRQSDYESRVFHFGSIYTPQLVVDGRLQVVGNDRNAVRRAIGVAAQSAKAAVNMRPLAGPPDQLRATVDITVPSGLANGHPLDVLTAVIENGLSTRVAGGENGGRLLKHSAVARKLGAVGAIDRTTHAFSTTIAESLPSSWKRSNLQLVAFVQDRSTRAILGAGAISAGTTGPTVP